jgi:hypothetical protein
MRSTFEAAVWATAIWSVVSFTGAVWTPCFWVFAAVHYVMNLCFVEYVETHSAEDRRFFVRLESLLVGAAIIQAIITSIIPTIAGMILLKVTSGWTHIKPDWLHVWLFVVCVAYNLSRSAGKRRLSPSMAL